MLKWKYPRDDYAALTPLGNHHRCELEIVEINIPNERAVIMKSMLASKNRLPRWAFQQNAQNHDYGRINGKKYREILFPE
jgi:hypothetical protein